MTALLTKELNLNLREREAERWRESFQLFTNSQKHGKGKLFSTQLVRAILPQLKGVGQIMDQYFLDRKILNKLLAN